MNKKILISLAIVIVLALVYVFYFSKPAPQMEGSVSEEEQAATDIASDLDAVNVDGSLDADLNAIEGDLNSL